MRSLALPLIAGALIGAATSAQAVEDYKITRCPPDLPYCIQEIKKAYTPAEIAEREAIKVDPKEEARKATVRADTGYRDPPIVRDTCPPPYRMDSRDGCHAAAWRSTRRD